MWDPCLFNGTARDRPGEYDPGMCALSTILCGSSASLGLPVSPDLVIARVSSHLYHLCIDGRTISGGDGRLFLLFGLWDPDPTTTTTTTTTIHNGEEEKEEEEETTKYSVISKQQQQQS